MKTEFAKRLVVTASKNRDEAIRSLLDQLNAFGCKTKLIHKDSFAQVFTMSKPVLSKKLEDLDSWDLVRPPIKVDYAKNLELVCGGEESETRPEDDFSLSAYLNNQMKLLYIDVSGM